MGRAIRNWFAEPWVPARYAAGRPDVHRPVAERIARRVAPAGRLARAADVGCGTGLSLRALGCCADHIVGVEPSAPMLAEASAAGSPDLVRGCAERMPLAAGSLDLLTIACAWHWCDAGAFLAEATRILRPGGWLVIYDSHFRGDPSQPELLDWLTESYWGRLAWVGRNPLFDPNHHIHPALHVRGRDELDVVAPMTLREVKTLITSQASTVANVERGLLTVADAEHRLESGLAPFWPDPDERRPMRFHSPIHFVERTEG